MTQRLPMLTLVITDVAGVTNDVSERMNIVAYMSMATSPLTKSKDVNL
jgi:hypothetical protein